MSLTNPINKSNLVGRFNQLVTAEINANINYASNLKPFPEAPNSWFGGTISGFSDISPSIVDTATPEVTASALFSAFFDWTRQMTRIRNARMRLAVTTSGGAPYNTPVPGSPRTGPAAPAYAEDVTGITFLSSVYQQTLPSVSASDVAATNFITRNGLDGTLSPNPNFGGAVLSQGLFQNLRVAWEQRRSNTVTLTTEVCHASCHSSCHTARGRR